MKIVNVHQRLLHASPERVAALIATLGQPNDQLWPRTGFPRMVLDGPLAVGAKGGHGPIRYTVEACEPGFVAFRFRSAKGWHAFEVLEGTAHHCVLEHRMELEVSGLALLRWLLVIRPLHDACLEELLSQAQASLGVIPRIIPRSPYVSLLLRWFSRASDRRTPGRKHHAA
jgi:hypothetical protein